MTITAYRIAPKPMTAADCHSRHESRLWDDCSDDAADAVRPGLSCCASLDDLVGYFSSGDHGITRGAILEGAYLVTLEGEPSDAVPCEAAIGELLIHPTRIVAQETVSERFTALMTELLTERHCVGDNASDRVRYIAAIDMHVLEYACHLCDGLGRDDNEECWECDGTGYGAQ